MQISGKYLLSSAETLLNRRSNRISSQGSGPDTSRELQPALMHSRLMQIQGHLAHVQHDYSREQARLASVDAVEGRENLQFDGAPLFPEKDTGDLRGKITDRLDVLGKQLKSLQVEMENMVALGFKPEEYKIDPKLAHDTSMRPIDPDRVARLTRSVPSES